MKKLTRLGALFGTLAYVGACGSGAATAPVDAAAAETIGGTGGAGTGGNGGAGGSACPNAPDLTSTVGCNVVPNNATSVLGTIGTGGPPPFNGGNILDGVYVVTKAETYGGLAGTGRRLTIVVADNASTILWSGEVLDSMGAVAVTFHAQTSAMTVGNQLQQTTECGSGVTIPETLTYTATSTQLILGTVAADGSVAVTTYTRTGCL